MSCCSHLPSSRSHWTALSHSRSSRVGFHSATAACTAACITTSMRPHAFNRKVGLRFPLREGLCTTSLTGIQA